VTEDLERGNMFREPSDVETETVSNRPRHHDVGLLWPFLKTMLRPYVPKMVLSIFILFIAAASLLGIGRGLILFIDEGFSGNFEKLQQASLIFAACTLFIAASSYGRLYLVSWVSEQIIGDFRKKVFSHLIQLDVSFFETLSPGEVITRLTTDVMLFQIVIGTSLPIAVRNLMIIFGGLGLLLYTCPSLTFLLLFVIPLVLIPMLFFGKKVRRLSHKNQAALAALGNMIEETFADMRSVHMFNRHASLEQQFNGKADAVVRSAMERVRMRALLTTLVILIVFLAIAFFIWWGGYHIQQGKMSAGSLSGFVFYATAVAGAMGSLTEIYADLQRAAGATQRFLELFNYQPTIHSPAKPIPLPRPLQGKISFEGVSFAYPSRPHSWVFENLNLEILPQEKVAFVGLSGEGKSSLFYLLLRLYNPIQGTILLDDIPIEHFALEDFRRVIGVVPQEPLLIQGTVLENIQFGLTDVTLAQASEAAKKAQILRFIEKLPKGFDTPLGLKGVRLSVGQRQRIALARAWVRNPRILLLDEATSSLDAEREHLIQSALKDIQDCTTLVIAHRLSTIQRMDRIIMLEKGTIVGSGTHHQLVRKNASYRKWVDLQGLEADEEGVKV
jgi:ATP-binding cassette, subfamily B, bacterial